MTNQYTSRLLFLFAMIIFNYYGLAQTVKGKIQNQKNEAIPFATIQIGEDYGVISNDEGNFSIVTSGFKASDSVTISCLGYEKLGMQLQEFSSQNYTLNERVNELSEVYITDRNLGVDSIMH